MTDDTEKSEELQRRLPVLEGELASTRQNLKDLEALLRHAMEEKGDMLLRELEAARVRSWSASEHQQKDPVTTLLRHGDFHARLIFEVQRSREAHEPLGLVMLDLDDFARFNQQQGYHQGERALAFIGQSLHSLWLSRPGKRPAVLGRHDGDCIGVILPAADHAETSERAEDIRNLVERLPLGPPRITVSVGAVTAAQSRDAAAVLVNAAQAAMRRVYAAGGNAVEVVVMSPPVEGGHGQTL